MNVNYIYYYSRLLGLTKKPLTETFTPPLTPEKAELHPAARYARMLFELHRKTPETKQPKIQQKLFQKMNGTRIELYTRGLTLLLIHVTSWRSWWRRGKELRQW